MSKKIRAFIDESLSTLDKYKATYKKHKEQVFNSNIETITIIIETTEFVLSN